MGYQVKLEVNTQLVKQALEDRKEAALYAIALQWLKNAVVNMTNNYWSKSGGAGIVDTGRLRNSLSFATTARAGKADASGGKSPDMKPDDYIDSNNDAGSVILGSNVNYAEFVELGTSKMPARPFLKDSLINYKDEYKAVAEMVLKGEI